MALTTTTLSGAISQTDTAIPVTSATGFAAGNAVRIDEEEMHIQQGYVAGTTPVLVTQRGSNGTAAVSHAAGANCITGLPSAFGNPSASVTTSYPLSGRRRKITSYSATGAIALPVSGEDVIAILNGTTGIQMTVAAPTTDLDGSRLSIASNGAATGTTITFTGGLNGASTGYTVFTLNSSKPVLIEAIAVNGAWMVPCAAAMTGTVTDLVGGIG